MHQRGKYPPSINFLTLSEIVKLIKDAGVFAVCAHPSKYILENYQLLLDCGIEGFEVLHPDITDEERALAHKICMENDLYISGGSDHSGLCGGFYDSFETREILMQSGYYLDPCTFGVYEQNFREIQTRKIKR